MKWTQLMNASLNSSRRSGKMKRENNQSASRKSLLPSAEPTLITQLLMIPCRAYPVQILLTILQHNLLQVQVKWLPCNKTLHLMVRALEGFQTSHQEQRLKMLPQPRRQRSQHKPQLIRWRTEVVCLVKTRQLRRPWVREGQQVTEQHNLARLCN